MTKVTWAADTDATFDDAADWSPAMVPGSGDDAVIAPSGSPITVTEVGNPEGSPGYATITLQSLTLGSGDTLAVQDTIIAAGSVANAGTIDAQVDPSDLGGTISNTGLLEATSGGELNLDGTITNTGGTIGATGSGSVVVIQQIGFTADAQSGAFVTPSVVSGGTLLGLIELSAAVLDGTSSNPITNEGTLYAISDNNTLTGLFENTGGVITAGLSSSSTPYSLRLQGATVAGGSVGLVEVLPGAPSVFDGSASPLTLDATAILQSGAELVLSGTIQNNAQIGLTYGGTGTLLAEGGVTLSGDGGVDLDGLQLIISGGPLIDQGNYFRTGMPPVVGTIDGAVIVDSGTIEGGAITLSGSLEVAGTALLGGGLQIAGGTAVIVDAGATASLGGAFSQAAGGSLTIAAGGTLATGLLVPTAFLAAPTSDGGVISVTSGVLDFSAAVTGGGTIVIAGGTVELDATDATDIDFTAPNSVLKLSDPAAFSGTVSGFSAGGTTGGSDYAGDTIDLTGIANATVSYSAGHLTVTQSGSVVATLSFAGNYAPSDFYTESDGGNGTDIGLNSDGSLLTWATGMNGDFGVGANWNPAQVPGRYDDTLIDPASPVIVTVTQDNEGDYDEAVNSLTLGAGDTLVTGNVLFVAAEEITNSGTIIASHTLEVNNDGTPVGGTLTNTGLIEPVSGGTLFLIASTLLNAGGTLGSTTTTIMLGGVKRQFYLLGGTLAGVFGFNFALVFDGTGDHPITLDGTLGLAGNEVAGGTAATITGLLENAQGKLQAEALNLSAATIAGGTIDTTLLVISGASATLDGSVNAITLGADAVVSVGGTDSLTLLGTFADAGSIMVAGAGTVLASGGVVLSGSGAVGLGAGSLVVSGGSLVLDGVTVTGSGGTVDGTLVVQAGSIVGTGGSAASLVVSGGLEVSGSGAISGAVTVLPASVVSVDAGAFLAVAGGVTVAAGGSISVADGGTLTGAATIFATVSNGGTIVASGGLLDFGAAVEGSGGLQIDAGATLELAGGATASSVVFASSGATLALGTPQAVSAVLSGLDIGDVIDLVNLSGAQVSFGDGMLDVTSGGTLVAGFAVAGSYAKGDFATESDGAAGTDIYLDSDAPAPTSIGWANDISGDFGNAADWNPMEVPDATTSALIDPDGTTPFTVTVTTAGDVAVKALTVDSVATLLVENGANADFRLAGPSGMSDNAGLVEVSDQATLVLAGSVANTGEIALQTDGSVTTLSVDGTVTLTGTGTVQLLGRSADIITGSAGATLVNIDNTIEGAGTIAVNVDNSGAIESTGYEASLTLAARTTITNTGTLGALSYRTNLILAGVVQNAGGTIASLPYDTTPGDDSTVTLAGTVAGGTLTGSAIQVSGSATLDGTASPVTLASDAVVTLDDANTLTLAGLIDNAGEFALAAGGSTNTLEVAGTVTLSGGGTVQLLERQDNATISGATGSELVNNDNTIEGAGTISVDVDNAGTIEATNYEATLEIGSGTTITNTGTLGALGYRTNLILAGVVQNAGGTIASLPYDTTPGDDSTVTLAGTVAGGTLTGSAIQVSGSATLDGTASPVTLASDAVVTLDDANTLTLAGLIDNAGEFALAAGGSTNTLEVAGTVTLSGGGTVQLLERQDNATISGATGSELVNNDNTIEGAGTISVDVDNAGTIEATNYEATLEIGSGTTITNTGTLGALGYRTNLILAGVVQNAGGTIASLPYDTTPGDDSTVTLAGTVAGGTLTGSVIEVSGSATLDGTASPVTLASDAVVTVDDGSTLTLDGVIPDLGSIARVGSGGVIVAPNADLTGSGSVSALISNAGLIEANLPGSTLTITGTVSGDGGLQIDADSTLSLGAAATAGRTVFAGDDATLALTMPQSLTTQINGFAPTDAVDLLGVTVEALTYLPGPASDSGTLVVVEGDGSVVRLDFSGSYDLNAFSYHPDGYTGTDIVTSEMPCFVRGTRILTATGEKPVEDLAIGDLVMTGAGAAEPILWIGRRSFAGRFLASNPSAIPVVIKAGALGPASPCRDLHLSPLHAMLLDGFLVPAGQLVNGLNILRGYDCTEVEYFHIELHEHQVVWAEGALSETFIDDDGRAMFHNASEFYKLYSVMEPVAPLYYAERLEAGYELEVIRATIRRRFELEAVMDLGLGSAELCGHERSQAVSLRRVR